VDVGVRSNFVGSVLGFVVCSVLFGLFLFGVIASGLNCQRPCEFEEDLGWGEK